MENYRVIASENDYELANSLQKYMTKVYSIMAGGVAITAITAFLIFSSNFIYVLADNIALFLVALIGELGLVWYLSSRAYSISSSLAGGLFVLYSFLNGLTLSVIFLVYEMGSIFEVFVLSTLMFAALAIYGYVTKRELSGFGTFLYMGLFGLIGAILINLFFNSSALNFAINVIGVIIFAGLTVWDTNKIKKNYIDIYSTNGSLQGMAINSALVLYLDFINLFLFLLRLFGDRK